MHGDKRTSSLNLQLSYPPSCHARVRISPTEAHIVEGPSDTTVQGGEMAVFNCSVTCGAQGASWYMTLPSMRKSIAISQYTTLSQMKRFYGLDVRKPAAEDCSNGTRRLQLLIANVTSELHRMPVQCGVIVYGGQSECACSNPQPQLQYSKLAILNVE